MKLRLSLAAVFILALLLSQAAFAQQLNSQRAGNINLERKPGSLSEPRIVNNAVPQNQLLVERDLSGSDNEALAVPDTYSVAPFIRDNLDNFHWASTENTPTSHIFNGSAELGGGNVFGTPGGLFRVAEGIKSLDGDVDRYIVQVTAVNSSIAREPWVDASWAGSGYTDWILEVGTPTGGGDPLLPGYSFSILNSGVSLFDSADNLVGEFDLYADASSDTVLRGTARIDNDGSDIAGVDVAAIQMWWDITPQVSEAEFSSDPAPGGTITFIDTMVGNSSPQGITVENTGGTALTISCSLSGAATMHFRISKCPDTVSAAGSDVILVNCEPSTIGLKLATLDLLTNDADESAVSYNLSCTGIVPSAENLIFGDSFEN